MDDAAMRMSALIAAVLFALVLREGFAADAIEEIRKDLERTGKSGYVSDQRERERAVRKLGSLNSLEAARLLVECLGDPLPQIRAIAAKMLGRMKGSLEYPAIVEYTAKAGLCDYACEERRLHAAAALGLMRAGPAADQLVRAYGSDNSPRVRAAAARALGLAGAGGCAKALQQGLSRGDESAGQAALALGRLSCRDAAEPLARAALAGRHWTARAHAIDALSMLKSPDLGAVCRECIGKEKDFRPRIAAVEALASVREMPDGEASGREFALQLLEKALSDKAWQVAAAAVETAIEMWDPKCIDILVAFLPKAEGSRLIIDAARALELYLGKDMGYISQSWTGWWSSNRGNFKLGSKPGRDGGRNLDKGSGASGEKGPTEGEFFSIPIFSRSFAFLFDFSGSMSFGSLGKDRGVPKIDIARNRFDECARKIGWKSFFNIYICREDFKWPIKRWMESFQNDLVPASPAIKSAASKWVHEAEVKGRGPFYDGLVQVTENPRIDTVFLLADGTPSSGTYVDREDFLEAWVAENRFRRVMVCPVMIGSSGTNAGLMKALAQATGGFYMHHKGE